ncbi:DUF6176 family protein [uncultured Acinetobacter sp.]|uniref:DUF6176 family protein n=1 Tax=uncultured Acinetobacter sp. TaxID=165433 RepID=UPI00258AA390|nr:DUF6176 family protein [uncultured Acinetobacter sp.]
MDVGAVLIRLKADRQDQVQDWQSIIEQRKSEAIETLKAEGVLIESWFHLELEHHHYLIAYMRAQDIKHAQQVAKTSTFEIDAIHKKFKENWDRVYPAKLLVDLENDTTDKMS